MVAADFVSFQIGTYVRVRFPAFTVLVVLQLQFKVVLLLVVSVPVASPTGFNFIQITLVHVSVSLFYNRRRGRQLMGVVS